MTETLHPSQPPPPLTPPPPTTSATLQLHPRREPFEHGLIPIQKLIFTTDPQSSLVSLKRKLATSTSPFKITSNVISQSLQISPDQSRLVLETLASVHHSDPDPLVNELPFDVESVGVDVNDLILFLYVQSYKRLLPRTHKDSASVADVWPSHSAFDGYLSALTPIQLVRSNSRRFIPSQTDEEAHQLSYLRKHLWNILSLLAEPVVGDEEPLVLTMENFEHLGFLIQFIEKGSEILDFSQATPFFASSDPVMNAVPVPVTQVHDWLLQQITSALEHISERGSAKVNSPSASDQDVSMMDACVSPVKASPGVKGPIFIEGVSKSSVVKQTTDFKGSSVKVLNCNDTVIYVLAPLKYATIYGCSDATIVLGAVGKAVRVEHCERVHVITATRRICIANCRECVFFLGVNQRPLIVGDNHKLQVAPYNTFYPQLVEHMGQVGIDATINKWDEPLQLGVVDPHDSLSHTAGGCDVQAESATHVHPEHFTNFLIPNGLSGEAPSSTEDNPFPLPDAYMTSNETNVKNLGEIKQMLREVPLKDDKKRELSGAIHSCFKDWLYVSGNIRQLYCQQSDESIR